MGHSGILIFLGYLWCGPASHRYFWTVANLFEAKIFSTRYTFASYLRCIERASAAISESQQMDKYLCPNMLHSTRAYEFCGRQITIISMQR